MKKAIQLIALSILFMLSAAGTLSAQATQPTNQQAETIVTLSYGEAVTIWTQAQPMMWAELRMTVDDLLTAYFRNGEGSIVKVAEKTYRVEMGGCIGILVIADSL